jgi:hypothetical protein
MIVQADGDVVGRSSKVAIETKKLTFCKDIAAGTANMSA